MDFRSLSTQVVLSFVALVLLTVTAVGVPAIWLMREQMSRQAWNQVDHGSRATQALYAARRSEIIDLAMLTAQRPTLRELVTLEKGEALSAYLHTLRTSARLDLMIVCTPGEQQIAQAGGPIGVDPCRDERPGALQVMLAGSPPQVWLLAAQPIEGEGSDLGEVIVGMAIDDAFAIEFSRQTGLEHTLLTDGQPVATSFAGGVTRLDSDRRLSRSSPYMNATRGTCTIDGHPYYFNRLSWEGTALEAEVALDVADIVATQRRLVGILIGSIVVVAAAGSILGVILAGRIGRPLGRLAAAATRMSQGDLDSPVLVEAEVREVALVAQALDSARRDLQRTLSHLRQEKSWTDHLLQAIVEGIVILDQSDRITFFSHGAERITGWRRDEVLNRPCDEVFRSVERDEPFSQLIPAPGRKHNIIVELGGGRQATLAVTGARLTPPEGGNAEVALVFRDISEEEAIHRVLGHFLANIAHEFRTPLSALAASTELLLDGASEFGPAELEQLLSSLHLGVLNLQTLVDNLLESASIEAGRFRVYPRPSDLGEIIAEAMGTMQPLLDKRGQRLTVELPAAIPVVRADPRRVAQVLVNLLSNASKYGPDHAEIAIGATIDDSWVRVTVADRGPGIPREYRKTLFRRFVPPSPSADGAQYGTGLGLSVVKAIVEAHGGQVGVDHRRKGGSIFWFTLPMADQP
ncbi:MAG: ATP-binding protein [Chloroflexota bacterium]|nr:ATP-binding protein [Chloroflexota bacterium]